MKTSSTCTGKIQPLQRRVLCNRIQKALCLAAVYEKSGRSRVMTYSALQKAAEAYSHDVRNAVKLIDERSKSSKASLT